MFGIELMRLLGGKVMELDTYRMRNGNVLVLTHSEFKSLYEVSIYNRSDIEERTWEFHEVRDARKHFDELKAFDQSPLTDTGAKR